MPTYGPWQNTTYENGARFEGLPRYSNPSSDIDYGVDPGDVEYLGGLHGLDGDGGEDITG